MGGRRTVCSGAMLLLLMGLCGTAAADGGPNTVPSAGPVVSVAGEGTMRETATEEVLRDPSALRSLYRRPADQWPAPWIDPGVAWVELGPVPPPRFPDHNPWSAAKARLGQQLFFDPRLSRSGQVACASCHDPDLAWADGRRVSFGEHRQGGRRNAPAITHAGHLERLFWDGRAATLEQQALFSLANPVEMATAPERAVRQLRAIPGYGPLFAEAFGSDGITAERISQAIATWVRSLRSRRSDFDDFLQGREQALSDAALQGLHLFRTRARCMHCHHGPLFTDQGFHNLGLHYQGRTHEDLGRYRLTGRAEDLGAFRTPGLRGVARTGPWMHNGLFPSLDGVLRFYNAGAAAGAKGRPVPTTSGEREPVFSPLLQPLGLDAAERAALEAFLHSLSPASTRLAPPELP